MGVLTGIKSVPKGTEANLTCSGEGMFTVQKYSAVFWVPNVSQSEAGRYCFQIVY